MVRARPPSESSAAHSHFCSSELLELVDAPLGGVALPVPCQSYAVGSATGERCLRRDHQDGELRRKVAPTIDGKLSTDHGPLLQIVGVPPSRDEPASSRRDQQTNDLLLHLGVTSTLAALACCRLVPFGVRPLEIISPSEFQAVKIRQSGSRRDA